MDYEKFRLSVSTLLEDGADPKLMNIDSIAADLDLGRAWFIYRSLTRVISPTSAEAERIFSYLSSLRSKFRRQLHSHLGACVRASHSKTLGKGCADVDLIAELVIHWDSLKNRKQRALGLSTGPHAKKARVEDSRTSPSKHDLFESENWDSVEGKRQMCVCSDEESPGRHNELHQHGKRVRRRE